jgi:small subunit ribosomal protein S14
MAKTVDLPANQKPPKWKVRHHNRCKQCGRARAFLRKFEMCRVCFRLLALKGDIPGVIKSSW